MSAATRASRIESAPAGRRPWYHWLVMLPAVGMLGGVPFVNRVHPLVLGLPLLFAWLVGWVLVTSAVMGCILVLDRLREATAERAADAAAPATAPAKAR